MKNNTTMGHMAALLTALIWGTTFISTKVLLRDFQPVEILFFRFVLALLILFAACPKIVKTRNWKEELTYAMAGLTGICLYYLLENIALTYTQASNVGVVVSVAPFFTAILVYLLLKTESGLKLQFFIGFAVAMIGIILISFNGQALQLNPKGDLLAVLAALVWAFYSVFIRKIGGFGYPVILSTRKTFVYGIAFMIPALFIFDFHFDLYRFADMTNLLNILFLGLGASALCFVTWNYAVHQLGAVKTSVYIYMIPVITVVTSALILHEPMTGLLITGTLMTLAGLVLSEFSPERKNRKLKK